MAFTGKVKALPSQPGVVGYFGVQLLCFARIGINPTLLQGTIISTFKIWFPMLSTMILCIFMLVYAVENISDLNKVTDALSPFWQAVLAIAKLIFFRRNKQKYVTLIRRLWLWNLEGKLLKNK